MDYAKEFLEDHSKRLEIEIQKIDPAHRTQHQSIFLQVVKQFGYRDIGVMMVFVLNVLVLKAGEWFLIPANIPHCYIQGELVEIMINSDNVIRGGLTPKHKDTTTLLQLLDFDNVVTFTPKAGVEMPLNEGQEVSILEYLDESYPELRVYRVWLPKFVKKWFSEGKSKRIVPSTPQYVALPQFAFLGLMVVISGDAKVETTDVLENSTKQVHEFDVPKLTQWYIKPGQSLRVLNKNEHEPLLLFIASPKD